MLTVCQRMVTQPLRAAGHARPWFARATAARSGHHQVDIVAAAVRAHQPLSPIENDGLGAVPLGDLRRVGLGPVTARLAPDYEPYTGRSRVAERHRRTQRRFLPPLSARRVASA